MYNTKIDNSPKLAENNFKIHKIMRYRLKFRRIAVIHQNSSMIIYSIGAESCVGREAISELPWNGTIWHSKMVTHHWYYPKLLPFYHQMYQSMVARCENHEERIQKFFDIKLYVKMDEWKLWENHKRITKNEMHKIFDKI